MGELEIRRLRDKFMSAMGPKADVRDFHDLVLLQVGCSIVFATHRV